MRRFPDAGSGNADARTRLLAEAVVMGARALQVTAWKSHHLACWRAPAPTYDRERYAPRGARLWRYRCGRRGGDDGACRRGRVT